MNEQYAIIRICQGSITVSRIITGNRAAALVAAKEDAAPDAPCFVAQLVTADT